MEWLTDVW